MAPLGTISQKCSKPEKFIELQFKWSNRVLGISIFSARHTVGKEIVSSFHFLAPQNPHKYAHTSGTSNSHV